MKTEEIKLKWQKHNRDHGMSWNEVAELVNEVIQPAVSEGEITKLWERFSFVHESSDEDFTVRLMTKPEFELAIQSLNVQGDAQQRYEEAIGQILEISEYAQDIGNYPDDAVRGLNNAIIEIFQIAAGLRN